MHAKHPITGSIVFLRELHEGDASETYAAWLNDPVVNQFLETRSVTVPELKAYIRSKVESPTALFLGIFWKEDGRHIGNIKLEPIDGTKKEATIGILIGDKECWGKGVATEATNLLTEYAFSELALNAVKLGVIPQNAAAIRVYEKCGFHQVEVEKDAMNHDGVMFDRVVMKKTKPIVDRNEN